MIQVDMNVDINMERKIHIKIWARKERSVRFTVRKLSLILRWA